MGEFLRTGEFAKLCGVSREAVRRWIDTGRLSASRLPAVTGRRGDARVSYAEARRFLEAGKFAVPPEILAATTPAESDASRAESAELAKGAA